MPAPYFGVSVRGPLHHKENLPNQDAWLGGRNAFGSFIVVCDGMGSRPHSQEGAQAACRAVRQSLVLWSKAKQPSLDMLPRLITPLWKLAISPRLAEECATTCLFAFLKPSGNLLCGGLGDGLIALKTAEDIQTVLGERSGFGNETLALGCPHRLEDWHLREFQVGTQAFDLLLATDGIADDLQQDRLGDFIAWLGAEFKPLPSAQRWRNLTHELKNWPTPNHLDDKTLALLWQE
jgi:serine/threonine protein phosphatase PrpC